MTTCEPLPDGGDDGLFPISSAADSPASPSASRGRAWRKPTRAGSGQLSRASFARYDPATCSWRTSRASLDGEWETYSETWPRAGMTRNGIAFRRPPSARPTSESGSGLLPTPSASSYGTNQGGGMGRTGPVRPSLETMARHDLWPAPTVADSRNSRNATANRSPGSAHHSGTTLSDFVTMWPTPKGSAANYGRPRPNDRGDLQAAVMRWPTPQARDHRTGETSLVDEPARHGGWNLNDWVGGQLNPTWSSGSWGTRKGGPTARARQRRRPAGRRARRADDHGGGTMTTVRDRPLRSVTGGRIMIRSGPAGAETPDRAWGQSLRTLRPGAKP